MTKDIRPSLNDWDFDLGQVTVRRLVGNDGREKLQLRLDLGMLQMEMTGRPDGKKPAGFESLLELHTHRLEEYRRKNGTDLGFALSEAECEALRSESAMYYHRYLSLFVLEDYEKVDRDTARNLRVFGLMYHYAEDESDRATCEAYRPYVLMMNTRARANLAIEAKAYRSALAHVDAGLRQIRAFLEEHGHSDVFESSAEVMILKALRQEIAEQSPTNPIARLKRELEMAVEGERYEEAARLRDKIAALGDGSPSRS